MAKPKPTKKAKKQSGSVFSGLSILAAIAAGMAFALPTMLVLAVGSLPTVVALMVDVHPRKYAAWSVGFFNFAGLMPYLGGLWVQNHTIEGAIGVLVDPLAWLVIYAAAAAGWMVYKGMPVFGAVFIEMKTKGEIRRLKAERQKLIHEWGRDSANGQRG